MPKYNLLSSGSTKIEKSNKLSDKYFSRIVYLAPDNLAASGLLPIEEKYLPYLV